MEVAFLDDAATRPPAQTTNDALPRLTVLVVAADEDVRRYLGECLGGRADLRICEASNTRTATELAITAAPDFAIVDHGHGIEGLSHLRAIMIVDDIPFGAATLTPRIRWLGRPFSAEHLTKEVDQLLRRKEQ